MNLLKFAKNSFSLSFNFDEKFGRYNQMKTFTSSSKQQKWTINFVLAETKRVEFIDNNLKNETLILQLPIPGTGECLKEIRCLSK
jgi:hypothetical protein